MANSQQIRNLRDAAKRRLDALVEMRNHSFGDLRKQLNRDIREVRTEVNRSYAKSPRTGKRNPNYGANVAELEAINAKYAALVNPVARKNIVVANELNQARRGLPSAFTEAEARIFDRATQQAWEGKSREDRTSATLEFYDEKSLNKLVTSVLEENKLAIKLAEGKELTAEELEELEMDEDSEPASDSEKFLAALASVVFHSRE